MSSSSPAPQTFGINTCVELTLRGRRRTGIVTGLHRGDPGKRGGKPPLAALDVKLDDVAAGEPDTVTIERAKLTAVHPGTLPAGTHGWRLVQPTEDPAYRGERGTSTRGPKV